MTRFLRLLFTSLTILVTACSLAALTGCRTQQTASSSSQHTVSRADTLRAVTLRSDTFRIHDSVYIREQTIGCTIRIEQHHWHTAWQTRTLRDTVACSGIGEIVGGSLIFPTFTDSPYGGYKFYASHMLETAMFLFGKDIRGVSASIMGKNMYCELIYDSFRVQSTMSDLRYYFSACVIGKHGTVEKKPVLPSDMGKYELAEFSALLSGKAPKQTPDELLFPVRLIDAIDRALESGKSEAVL